MDLIQLVGADTCKGSLDDPQIAHRFYVNQASQGVADVSSVELLAQETVIFRDRAIDSGLG